VQNLRPLYLALAMALSAASPVWAHAHAHETTPNSGAVLTTPPKAVTILFSDDIQLDASRIEVRDNGQLVSQGKPTRSAKNPRLISVALKTPRKGQYQVIWHALAEDGHPSKGKFDFIVK